MSIFNTMKAIISFFFIIYALLSICLGCSAKITDESVVPYETTPIPAPTEVTDKSKVDAENQTRNIINNSSNLSEKSEVPIVTSPTKYKITIEVHPLGAGVVTTEPHGDAFNEGTEVTLQATAEVGFTLDHWLIDRQVSENITSIILTSDQEIVVYFVPNVDRLAGPEVIGYLDKKDEIVIVDVRSVQDYDKDHIPGAISIPSDEIESRYNEIPPDKIVFIYASCIK